MYLRLTSSALALALSVNAVVSSGDANAVLTNRVNSSYRQKEGGNTNAATHHQTEQVNAASIHVADGSKLGADVGLLGGRIGRRRHGNDLFGNRHRRAAGSGGNGPRFLQEATGDETEEGDACYKPDTCEPNLCECVANGGKGFTCAAELNAVCNGVTGADGTEFTIDGCVKYAEYYTNLYCPFAACIVEGETYESCACTFYDESCSIYGNDPKYVDDEDTILHCAVDSCCKSKDGDDGTATCFEEALTSMPSSMPIGPTVSPTTGSPTVTPKPTPTSSPAKAVTSPALDPTSPGDVSPTRPTAPDKPLTDAPLTGDSDTPANPDGSPATTATSSNEPNSTAQSVTPWGIVGATSSFVAGTIVWSLLS